ncbi:hypothetical protein GRJ2_001843000 [Grus japonensis]|uniref:Secreted protein n=1 Tax=Grus japonensis TaxID=30415 RepID=A0ABC9X9S0_GRUJA
MLLSSVLSIRYGLVKGCCQGLLGIDGTEDGPTTGPPRWSKNHQGRAVTRMKLQLQRSPDVRCRKSVVLSLEENCIT